MTGQLLSLLTPLALLLLVGLADLSLASVDDDEDYYMQEMLTRERYNQVRLPENPISSTADAREEVKQNPAKNMPKGEVKNKKTDKITDPTKSVKAPSRKTVKNKKSSLKESNSITVVQEFNSMTEVGGGQAGAYIQQSMGKRRGTPWTGRQSIAGQHTNNHAHTHSYT
ncbi:hypothetical protein AMECASPLE_027321 [Ameca splendens]|uniref:Uncharacterized protein n=1 Tax=Ameca splendens TaxID=208324 RepID=A0ABV0XU17_9TELE